MCCECCKLILNLKINLHSSSLYSIVYCDTVLLRCLYCIIFSILLCFIPTLHFIVTYCVLFMFFNFTCDVYFGYVRNISLTFSCNIKVASICFRVFVILIVRKSPFTGSNAQEIDAKQQAYNKLNTDWSLWICSA